MVRIMKWSNVLFIIKLLAFIAIMLIFQGFSTWLGAVAGDSLNYSKVDPDNAFARDFIVSIFQMLPALLIILILSWKYKRDFGFKLGDRKTGFMYVSIFLFVVVIYSFIYHYVTRYNNPYIVKSYPLNMRNIIGVLGLENGITGPSEEILFRVLPITFMMILFKKSFPLKWGVSLEVLVAALLFVFAHGQYVLTGNFYFMGFVFVAGIIYGVTYQKTGSILYPMIMHSMTNIIILGLSFVLQVNNFYI